MVQLIIEGELKKDAPLNYLCNIHQLVCQLFNFILTPQHVHVVMVGPAIE